MSNKNVLLFYSLALLAVLSSSYATAEDRIGYAALVPFDETADIRQAIKDECKLDERVVTYLGKYLKGSGYVSDDPSQGKFLDMKITQVRTAGGGLYSGAKWMEVQGTLHENGVAGPSFRAKRFTTKGGRACSSAAKCAKAISKDISIWLQNPVDSAILGDAK